MSVKHIQDVAPYAVNFSIVVVMLAAMLRKPARKFIYQRHERMKDAIETAARAHQKAASRAEAARGAVSRAGSEEAALMQRERQQAEVEKADILQKAESEARRVLLEAERLASVEQEAASDRVRDQFVRQVVRQAEESLRQGLKKDDHSAILKRAQNSIEVGV